MSEHFYHLLPSFFLLIFLLFYFAQKISFQPFKLFALLALFSFLTFHAFPLHSVHAVYLADQSTHQCCLPTAVTPVVAYEIVLPDKIIAEGYLVSEKYLTLNTLFFNSGRSPPLV